jgi:hypothetical protein
MELHKTDGIEPHWTEDAGKRSRVTRLLGWIFVGLGVLQLILGEWAYGVFLLVYALFLLAEKTVERLPKVVRYLLVAAFAVFAAFLFVKMVSDLKALK